MAAGITSQKIKIKKRKILIGSWEREFLNDQGKLRNAFPWRPCREVFTCLFLEQFCPEALDQMTYLGSFQSAA